MQDSETSPSTDNPNNLDLIYEYANFILKNVNDDVDAINTKLGTTIVFNAALIRVAVVLPDSEVGDGIECYSCIALKFIIFILLISSIWLSSSGLLTPALSVAIAKPSELLENWYGAAPEVCKLFILKGVSQAITGLDRERERKAQQLSRAIRLLTTAVTLLAIGFLLPSLINLIA